MPSPGFSRAKPHRRESISSTHFTHYYGLPALRNFEAMLMPLAFADWRLKKIALMLDEFAWLRRCFCKAVSAAFSA
jgi:hypothetical protein